MRSGRAVLTRHSRLLVALVVTGSWTAQAANRLLDRVAELRHHDATVLLAAGEAVVVAERLGHENANLVLSTYGQLMPESEERTRAAVDSAWVCAHDVPSGLRKRPTDLGNVAASDVEAELHHDPARSNVWIADSRRT